MTRRLTIFFLLSTVLLLISEYIMLREIYAEKRFVILLVSSVGAFIGIIGIVKFYKQYKRFI